MSTPSTSSEPDSTFVFLRFFLEERKHYELIVKKWLATRGTTKQARAYCAALACAKWALHDQLNDYCEKIRERGQLLFAFEGTTVLQGGAV